MGAIKHLATLCAFTASLYIAPVAAAEVHPADKQNALYSIVAMQELEEQWPATKAFLVRDGPKWIRKYVLQELERRGPLPPAQRKRAEGLLDERASVFEVEIVGKCVGFSVKARMASVVDATFSRFFTPAEIIELGRYYDSPAFKRVGAIKKQAYAEIERTGESEEAVLARYGNMISPADLTAASAFQTSPLGQKWQRTVAELTAYETKYLSRMNENILIGIGDWHVTSIAAELKLPVRPQ